MGKIFPLKKVQKTDFLGSLSLKFEETKIRKIARFLYQFCSR
jgi:hypothetical protein